MGTTLRITDEKALQLLFPNRTVCDPAVGPAVADAAIEAGQTFLGDALSVNVHGTLGIRAFNSSDDQDEDGILGAAGTPAPVDKLPPQLTLAPGTALLKYKAAASLRAKAAGQTLPGLGFAIDSSLDVLLADYHRHPCTTGVTDALTGDLSNLRSSLRVADVLALGTGEAVSQQVVGRLSAAVELSWSDIFMGPIGPLARLVGPGAAVMVKVSAAASLKATVSISDDYLVVFSKATASTWRVGLRKARTRGASLGLDLGVTVEFADPKQIAGILAQAIEGVLGQPRAKVDQILAKASLEALSPAERRIADALIARLGLTPAVATMDALRTRVEAVFDGIDEAVRAVATAKIALAFGYEYRRIRQDTTVAQCLLDETALKQHHKEIVRGRFGGVFSKAAAGAPGLTLEHFLYQKTVRSEQSWGFALSLGKWLALGGKDRKALTRVDRQTATGAVQRAYIGSRGYRDEGDTRDHWSADLSATMPGYSRASTPLVAEYEVGLAVSWFEPRQRLTDDVLASWLDLAVLWGVIPESQLAQWTERLADVRKARASLVAQVTVPHRAFSAMLPRIATAAAGALGSALGSAMPWMDVEGRRSPAARRASYGPLWTLYLSDPDHVHRKGRDFARAAREHLEKQGLGDLARMERLYDVTPSRPHDGRLFCGLIDLNPHTLGQCQDFVDAARRLHADTVSGAPDHGVIPAVFDGMENFWAQGHHVRAVGAYLLEIAQQAGVVSHVTRSLAISVEEGPHAGIRVLGS